MEFLFGVVRLDIDEAQAHSRESDCVCWLWVMDPDGEGDNILLLWFLTVVNLFFTVWHFYIETDADYVRSEFNQAALETHKVFAFDCLSLAWQQLDIALSGGKAADSTI